MMQHRFSSSRADWWIGAVAGIVGGLVYTVFVEAATVVANGAGAFFRPFRQIGAVALGPQALDPGYDLLTAAGVGTVLHLAIAAVFGVAMAWTLARLRMSALAMIALGAAAGLAFYALNLFVIFPAAFPWFLENSRFVQSIGHALFGGTTAAWLSRFSRV